MGNKHTKHLAPVQPLKKSQTVEITPKPPKPINENLIWLDPNVNNPENLYYQREIKEINKFHLFLFTNTKECISKLKTIHFQKTYILVSGSLSKEFFIEFEKIINEILICPEVIIFTSKSKLNLIKKNILGLEKFSFFDVNLLFDDFYKVYTKLSSEDIYKPNYKEIVNFQNYEDCFTFEYINELRDLIFPLTFIEFIEFPSKIEILDFNKFLLDKYQENYPDQNFLKGIQYLKGLTQQLLLDIKIPIPILVKYWIRAYTVHSPFYREINYTLIKKLNNDFDTFIRVLYQGLITKSIKPLIDEKLYRGSMIKIKEINYIKESLNKKKENIPGCICYNKSFLSTSLDERRPFSFIKWDNIGNDEKAVLFIIEKENKLDDENATNLEIQDYSYFAEEKEILFLPFSCFEIKGIKNCFNEKEEKEYIEINLTYIGKYKNKIDTSEKIPESQFVKDAFSSNFCDKNEMNKESNKKKFDFDIEKYIPPNIKQSQITAVYDITSDDINKKIQIINYDEKINENELKKICNIYLNQEKVEFTSEYIFKEPGKYTFEFEFDELLTNANKLFYGCSTLISLNFDKFKSNYIKDMTDMFNGCSKLLSLSLSNFKTKEVTTMKGTFKGCSALKALDLSNFDTKNVTDMSEMFSECSSLTFLNFSNFDTQNVKTMYRMFYKCTSLYFINLSNFKSNSVVNISEMFSDCTSLNYLDLSLFEINDKINTDKMFFNCLYFKSLKDEFISEISNNKIENRIQKISEKFFLDESLIISQNIQFFTKNNKFKNIELLNQSIEEIIKEIKHINILILGQNDSSISKSATMKTKEKKESPIFLGNNDNNNNCDDDSYLRFYEGEEMGINIHNIEENINKLNKKGLDYCIHFIWFCISGKKINENESILLNKLMNNKYKDKFQIFILYLNPENNNNFDEFKEDLNKKYTDKKFEIFQISSNNIYEDETLDDVITKINNNFNNVVYQNIHNDISINEKVKLNIEKIIPEKDLDDIPDSLSKYFEKLLGKRDDINQYIYKHIKTSLNYSKTSIGIDTMKDFIDNFKEEKLKLKVTKSKSKTLEIENLDDEFNKELKKRYNEISKNYYDQKFKEELFNYFSDFLKKEAEKIIGQVIKELKFEDYKVLIEKYFNFENN